jgi:lysophospholipid acyltransferase (LPLAT)-like uncharacterized protein
LRFLKLTYRFRYEGNERLRALAGQNFILAIWHQNLLAGILAQTGKKHIVIISKSKDGDPVAYACARLGHEIVRGSSRKGEVNKGGHEAKEGMIEQLRLGFPGAITVDGPKGPAFKVKPGIINMARSAHTMIVPYTLSFSAYWQFKSWDSFRLPKPFSKILISYGAPLNVLDVGEDFNDQLLKLETALLEQTKKVDGEMINWESHSKKNWFQ